MGLLLPKTKLTEELIEDIGKEVEEGLPIWYTCDLLMVPRNLMKEWMNQGEQDVDEDKDTLYARLFINIRHKYASYLKGAMKAIKEGGKMGIGSSWWLERVDPTFRINKEPDNNVENITITTRVRK